MPSFRTIAVLVLAVATAVGAHAQQPDTPVPRPRPSPDSAEPARPDEAEAPSACRIRLTADIAVIETLPPVTGADGCGIEDPVRLSVVLTKDKRRLAISPPVMLGCAMAEAVARWLRDDLVEMASTLGAPLSGLSSGQGYQCRGRNGVAGAPMSQHGRGNALDIRAIMLANGQSIDPTDIAAPKEFRERLKASACAHFTTVLGPGSDGHHETHLHLDVAERRSGYRLCQWDVRVVADAIPLPRERPAEAPPRAHAR